MGLQVQSKFLKISEYKAMAQNSCNGEDSMLPYKDLASEVTRRRVSMTVRYLTTLHCPPWGVGLEGL